MFHIYKGRKSTLTKKDVRRSKKDVCHRQRIRVHTRMELFFMERILTHIKVYNMKVLINQT